MLYHVLDLGDGQKILLLCNQERNYQSIHNEECILSVKVKKLNGKPYLAKDENGRFYRNDTLLFEQVQKSIPHMEFETDYVKSPQWEVCHYDSYGESYYVRPNNLEKIIIQKFDDDNFLKAIKTWGNMKAEFVYVKPGENYFIDTKHRSDWYFTPLNELKTIDVGQYK